MSLYAREPEDKYCFTYCGPERCNCARGASRLDDFREWFERRVDLEGNDEIGAGFSLGDGGSKV